MRRLGFAAVRDLKKAKGRVENGYLCVFIFKKSPFPLVYRVVFKEVEELLLKAGLIKDTKGHEY